MEQEPVQTEQEAVEVKEELKPAPEEPEDFTKYLIAPHTRISRDVEEKDLEKVLEDAHILYQICWSQVGIHRGGFAVAHSQINDTDPLRFFVTNDKRIIINPVITNQTKTPVKKTEGCLSFPNNFPKEVLRSHKITVSFDEIDGLGKTTYKENVGLSGREAEIFQHEIDHFNAIYIYE